MMFADATPDANSFLQFWLILSLIFSTLVSIGTFAVMVLNRKQKREVSFEFTPASKEEHDEHVAETKATFDAIRKELKEDRHDNQVHASTRSASIYKQIENTRVELEKKIQSVADDVRDTPERVIAILRNAGRIK